MSLKWVYPQNAAILQANNTFVLGSVSSDVDEVTLNNIPVPLQTYDDEKAFAFVIALKEGLNEFQLRTNTGEHISRSFRRIIPIHLSEDAPVRPFYPKARSEISLAPGVVQDVILLAHNTINSIWLELQDASGTIIAQQPMVKRPQHNTLNEHYVTRVGISGKLYGDTDNPALEKDVQIFETRFQIDETYAKQIADGETLMLNYAIVQNTDDVKFIHSDVNIKLWRFPRYVELGENTLGMYFGNSFSSYRNPLLPGLGTPFPVYAQLSDEHYITKLEARQLSIRGAKQLSSVGNRCSVPIQAAQISTIAKRSQLTLLADSRYPYFVESNSEGVDVLLSCCDLGLTSVHTQGLDEEYGCWELLTSQSKIQWKARNTSLWKGFKNHWVNEHLVLQAHFLPRNKEDARIVLDPGHGGEEMGTRALNSIPEKDWVLNMAFKLRDKLYEKGFEKVYLTRENDSFLSLKDREHYALSRDADITLSIHVNALPDGENPASRRGYSVHTYTPWSFNLARSLMDSLALMNRPCEGHFQSNFAMTRLPTSQSALIEYGYFIHPQEYKELQNPDIIEHLAEQTAQALLNVFTE